MGLPFGRRQDFWLHDQGRDAHGYAPDLACRWGRPAPVCRLLCSSRGASRLRGHGASPTLSGSTRAARLLGQYFGRCSVSLLPPATCRVSMRLSLTSFTDTQAHGPSSSVSSADVLVHLRRERSSAPAALPSFGLAPRSHLLFLDLCRSDRGSYRSSRGPSRCFEWMQGRSHGRSERTCLSPHIV